MIVSFDFEAIFFATFKTSLFNFDLEKPYKSVPFLAGLYKDISKLDDNYWKAIKLKEVSDLIQNCLGLRLQFNTFQETGVVKTSLPTQLLILNPSPIAIKLEKIDGAINLEISKKLIQNYPSALPLFSKEQR